MVASGYTLVVGAHGRGYTYMYGGGHEAVQVLEGPLCLLHFDLPERADDLLVDVALV